MPGKPKNPRSCPRIPVTSLPLPARGPQQTACRPRECSVDCPGQGQEALRGALKSQDVSGLPGVLVFATHCHGFLGPWSWGCWGLKAACGKEGAPLSRPQHPNSPDGPKPGSYAPPWNLNKTHIFTSSWVLYKKTKSNSQGGCRKV